MSKKNDRTSDAKALLAICELMQCKLLSPVTIAYLQEVRDSLQAQLEMESRQDSDESIPA